MLKFVLHVWPFILAAVVLLWAWWGWRRPRPAGRRLMSDQVCPHCWQKLQLDQHDCCGICGQPYDPADYGDNRMR